MLFQNKETCLDYLIGIDKYVYRGSGLGCNGTFDTVVCWESVPANTSVTIPCPKIVGLFDIKKNLTKTCLPNGFWEGYEKDKHAGYTDFKVCYTERVLKDINSDNANEENEIIYKIVSHIEFVGLILSLICICFSLTIFFYHKNLRCKRTKIHLNLFLTILLCGIIRILFFVDHFLFKINNADISAYESYFMQSNKAICPIMTVVLEYVQTCNFMWMLNEGVYLNILLTYSIFDNNRRNIIILFYIIGWGLPALIVFTWAMIVYSRVGIDDICWSGYYKWDSYWIINAFIIAILFINIVCLVNVIRILSSKLRENCTSEVVQLKKSAKAAILLLPLLGITHIFEVYYGEPSNWTLNLILSCIKAFLVFYQGVFLSILYCFMNNEVKNVIRRHWLAKINYKKICCLVLTSKTHDREFSSGGGGGAGAGDKDRERDKLMKHGDNNDTNIPLSDMYTYTNTKSNLMSNTESTII